MTFWMPSPGVMAAGGGGGLVVPRVMAFSQVNKYSAFSVQEQDLTLWSNRTSADSACAAVEPILEGEKVYWEWHTLNNSGAGYARVRLANSFDNNGGPINNTTYGAASGTWTNECCIEIRRASVNFVANGVFSLGTDPAYSGWTGNGRRVGCAVNTVDGHAGLTDINGNWLNNYNPNTGVGAMWTWTPQPEIWIIAHGWGGGAYACVPGNGRHPTYPALSHSPINLEGFVSLDGDTVF